MALIVNGTPVPGPDAQSGPRLVPLLASGVRVDLTSATLVGGAPGSVDPAVWAVAGRTTAFTLAVAGSVSRAGLSGVVTLVDDLGATVATVTVTATVTTSYTATVTVPSSARVYELRARLTAITGPDDYLTLTGAALRITWS